MDNKNEIYAEWSKLVNMTKSELQKFYDSAEGKQAGLSKKEADEKGIHSGRESARWILKMKSTPKSKWTQTMWGWAKRQISFIKRMSGVDGSLRDENGKPTRKLLALKIWGNDPEKFNIGGEIKEKTMENKFYENESQGDLFNESSNRPKSIGLFGSNDISMYARGGQLDYALLQTEDWDDVPVDWKNTNVVKPIKWEANPKDEGLNRIVKTYAGDDELRPVLSGINFDDNGITATDALKLIHIPAKTEFRGIFPKLKSKRLDLNSEGKIDGKYANYKAVYNPNAPIVFKVDLYKVIQYCQVAENYCNKGTFSAGFKVGSEFNAGFNVRFLSDVCKSLLELGYKEVYSHFTEPSRACVLSPDKVLTDDSIICLIMPVFMRQVDELGTSDLNYNKRLSCYFDFEKNEIINGDGSVVDFKMNYGKNKIFTPELVKAVKNAIPKKTNAYILESFLIKDKQIVVTDLYNTLVIKDIDIKDGLYDVQDGAVSQSSLKDDVSDYPKTPIIEDAKIKFRVDSDYFIWVLESMKDFLGKDDLRPIMTKMNISKQGKVVKCASTDSYILKSIDVSEYFDVETDKDFSINVEIKQNLESIKYLNNGALFLVEVDDFHVKIESEKGYIISRLEGGRYPNYEQVIPVYTQKGFKVEREKLKKLLNSSEAKSFISKNKKWEVDIHAEISGDELAIYLYTTNGYGNKIELQEKSFIGKIPFETFEPNQTGDTVALIMPIMDVFKSEETIFNFGYSVFERFEKELKGDILSFSYIDISKAYLVGKENIYYEAPKIKTKKAIKKQVEKGLKVEQEHKETLKEVASGDITVNEAIEKTVDDHLKEDENYYDKLEKVEGKESISDLIEALELLGEKDLVYALRMLGEDNKFAKGGQLENDKDLDDALKLLN